MPQKTKILVTGGAGYIGAHTLVDLIETDFDVVCVDNFMRSDSVLLEGIKKITGREVKNYEIDLTDEAATFGLFAAEPNIVGVIHFAALRSVGESTADPIGYFKNNLNSLLNVLAAMKKFDIKNFIFSSSCSVYGNTTVLPVSEDNPLQSAESPYARTKQMGEQIIIDFAPSFPGFAATLLRYFNPAGAHASLHIGERRFYAQKSLVPAIAIAAKQNLPISVHGTDYPTRDGSCIRDYIHVVDLANAHTKALQFLLAKKNKIAVEIFNLGIGNGVSVLEAIAAFERVTDKKLLLALSGRREGDVVAVYADYKKAQEELGWQPILGIDEIMLSAWNWEQTLS